HQMETDRQKIEPGVSSRIVYASGTIGGPQLRIFFEQAALNDERMLDREAAKCPIGHRQAQNSRLSRGKLFGSAAEDRLERRPVQTKCLERGRQRRRVDAEWAQLRFVDLLPNAVLRPLPCKNCRRRKRDRDDQQNDLVVPPGVHIKLL